MLREYKRVRQIQGEARRRWFTDSYFDLIFWFDTHGEIVGFQLCYDIAHNHRALTWHRNSGYAHNRVDDGEKRPGKMKASPILVADGLFEHEQIAERFKKASREMEKDLASFVYEKLIHYPAALPQNR